jgi:hypothetical protein
MKKIINGAKYDTETAKQLGNWSNSSNSRDLNYCEETLHRTKSGKYFLHGQGGPQSKYSESLGDNHWGYGHEIIPMTREAAQAWAEKHLDADEYEAAFGEVAEDGKEQLNVTISPVLKAKLWETAESRKMSISALVEEILSKSI